MNREGVAEQVDVGFRLLCGGARRVKDDLVVLPKALEKPQASVVLRCKMQNFGEGSIPVDARVFNAHCGRAGIGICSGARTLPKRSSVRGVRVTTSGLGL